MAFTEKDFLEEVSALKAELRKEMEAHQAGLDPSPAAIKERRRRVLKDGDFKFFAYTYFPHHIRGESSIFQESFCERFPKLLRMATGVKEWWKAPRGEAKSSLLTKVGPVWCNIQLLLQLPEIRAEVGWEGPAPYAIDYITVFGAETKLPAKLIEVVKTELTVNAALALDFPEAVGATKNWKIGEIITRTGLKVESFGAEQAVRGTFHGSSRPKLLLGDDLITDAEAKSPTEREKRWDWLEKGIDYLGPPDGTVKFLAVGTELAKGDPISRAENTIGHIVHAFKAIEQMPSRMDLWERCEELMRNEDPREAALYTARGEVCPDDRLPSFQFYQRHKAEMDEGAVTSWPSVRSLFWLMRQRAKNRKAFNTEMQGVAKNDEDKVFGNITFWVNKLSHWVMFGACDPSMGKGESSDPSALLVGGWNVETAVLNVIEAEIKRRVPSKLESDLIEMQREYRMRAIGFENNNAYEYMRQSYVNNAAKKNVALPLVGVTAVISPEERIDSLEPFICDAFNPKILLHPKLIQLLDEMDTWPEKQSHHHYDGLTALQILWMVSVSRSSSMQFKSTGVKRAGSKLGDYTG